MSQPKTLLVTLAIGKKYLDEYNRLFRKSQEEYAAAHGYDFRVVSDYLDKDRQIVDAISFNKILVCSQDWSRNYDYIIFIDADILIRPGSPAVHTLCIGRNEIGIVDEFSQPTTDMRLQIQKAMKWEETATDYYKLCDFDIETTSVLNTGLLVMQPAKHAAFLENVYNTYVGKATNHPRGFHYEQSAIGYELMKNNMHYILPNQYNMVWGMYRIFGRMTRNIDINVYTCFINSYMMHFAGKVDLDAVEGLWNSVSKGDATTA